MKTSKINVTLQGIAPILFNRFVDYSKEVRPPEQKLYIDSQNTIVLPSLNIDAFLFGEFPTGCAKTFEGKKGKDYLRIGQSHVFVEPDLIPFTDGKKEIKYNGFGKQLMLHDWGSPRVKNGSLSVKQERIVRPMLNLPWELTFSINLIENSLINSTKLENWFTLGGIMLAFGSWRPKYGRFTIKKWEETK